MTRFVPRMAAIVLAAMSTPAVAGILVDTGPQVGNDGGGDTISTGQYLAGQFTIGSATVITDVEAYIASDAANTIALALYSDSAGLPGSSLFSGNFIAAANGSNGAWQGLSGLNWAVSSGTYWLSIENQTGGGAYAPGHVPNPLSAYAFTVGDQGWRPGTVFGLRISDNSPAGAIPEPTTWAILVLGFASIGFAMRCGKARKIAVSFR